MANDSDATLRVDADATLARPSRRNDVQFAPGTIVAARYRISSILGSGGMGEVYRADDTKLDQPVALKFLPARLARDKTLLARLHDEVRLGRQIAHPNVCRIYDISEAEGGAHFVAMEYVDGEDLSRLLRRIGRLAPDKAVDISRGIAAGLLAAHAKGILHRDLKPANIMVDSRGEARVMDFGLALGAGEDDGTISGTPAYMAPEQLAGQPATVQSDIYALGLVMYELVTGKRAHSSRTLTERMRDISSEITTPSSVIRDIEPAVERIILRCLASDPAQRPRSAREVIDSLPGGDALAAALAAGETPSPGMIAAAGAEGSLSPAKAWSILGAIALLLTLSLAWRASPTAAQKRSLERSPAVLWDRADETLRALGLPVTGLAIRQTYTASAYLAWRAEQRQTAARKLSTSGPDVYRFRVERGPTLPLSLRLGRDTNAPGWSTIEIDSHGRLTHLLAAPADDGKPMPLDWQKLLAAAKVDAASLQSVVPTKTPVAPFDTRAAWSGRYPHDETPLYIEAAAWRGTPTFFTVTGPWDSAGGSVRSREFGSDVLSRYIIAVLFVVWTAGGLLAWRNFRSRRGDRRGALIVAAAMFAFTVAESFCRAAAVAGAGATLEHPDELLGRATSSAIFLFMVYLAIEPYARRRWPEQLIAAMRLLAGRVRDPLVGRDVLIGVLAGIVAFCLALSTPFRARDGDVRMAALHRKVGNVWDSLAAVADGGTAGLGSCGLFIIVLVLLTIVVRKKPLAIVGLFGVQAMFFILGLGHRPEAIPSYVGIAAVLSFMTVRYGALAVAVTQGTFVSLFGEPLLAGAGWATAISPLSLVAIAALTVWAFYVSLGGQSPFSASLLDE